MHLKAVDVERKRTFNSQYVKDEESRLLRHDALIRERWVRRCHTNCYQVHTKSPRQDLPIVDAPKVRPQCRTLDGLPSSYEIDTLICAMANCKAVGPDGLPIEILKVLAYEGDPYMLGGEERACRNNGRVPRSRCCPSRNIGWSVVTIEAAL